jgi:phosphatidylinositol alpha-1,6-mannosyltransferase
MAVPRPKRICVVTWELQPDSGWGRYSIGLIRGLREHGMEVRVLVQRRASSTGVPPGVDVYPCLSSPLGPLDRPHSSAWNVAQLIRHARGSDLVHFFVEPYALAASPWLPWPYLVTIHGTYGVVPLRGHPVLRLAFARSLRRAAAVVCVSRFTRRRISKELALDNLEVINNGLELPVETPGNRNGHIAGDPVLLGVGALKPRKGYHVTVDALPKVRERYPNVHYYAVGDDADRRYVAGLREAIARHGLDENVTITGRIDDGSLAALYRRADVFVLTPVNSGLAFEGFGLTYLEANAHGKPVVGSRDCGAEDAIVDQENGLLVPQSNPDAVADSILRLLDDRAAAERMGRRGREMAIRRDWQHVAAEYVAQYERVLGR